MINFQKRCKDDILPIKAFLLKIEKVVWLMIKVDDYNF
jgi:hypothetical protein